MRLVLVMLFSVVLASCLYAPVSQQTPVDQNQVRVVQSTPMPNKVNFETDDGVTIVGNWYPVLHASNTALLLHMMPETKESWRSLAAALNEKGVSALAIDLRGHGESTKKNSTTIDFRRFSDRDHQESIKDIETAVSWLSTMGYGESSIALVGASIGANLALQFAASHPMVERIALVSPGFEYRGIQTESAMRSLSPETRVLLLASKDDTYSADTVDLLTSMNRRATSSLVDGSGHGTAIFQEHPDLVGSVTSFLTSF